MMIDSMTDLSEGLRAPKGQDEGHGPATPAGEGGGGQRPTEAELEHAFGEHLIGGPARRLSLVRSRLPHF